MAKQGKAAAGKKNDLRNQCRDLWDQPPQKWVAFLKSIGCSNIKSTGTTVTINCPYHIDAHPSGVIHLDKKYYKCYAGTCGAWRPDPIRVVRKLLGSSYTEAFNVFRRYFNLSRRIHKERVAEFDEAEAMRRRLFLLSDAFHAYLCNIWQADTCPESAAKARDWLKNNRKITDVQAMTALGLLPRELDLKALITAHTEYTAGDWEWQKKFLGNRLSVAYNDSLVYTYARSPKDITAFKFVTPGDKQSTYMLKLDEEEERGAFGISHAAYAPLFSSNKIDSCVVFEGEHDQLMAYHEQTKKGVFDEIFLAIGGSGHTGLDALYELGMKKASIVGDDDEAGEKFPAGVLSKTHKISCQMFIWPVELRDPTGGNYDPDDAIRFHGFSAFKKAVLDPKAYTQTAKWAYTRAVEQLAAIDVDDVSTQESIALDTGNDLKIEAELKYYVELISKKYPALSAGTLLQAITKHEDTELGFINKLTDWINHNFQVISLQHTVTSELKLWHLKKREEVTVRLGTRAGIFALRSYVPHGILCEWIPEEFGVPGFISEIGFTSLNSLESTLEKYLEQALSKVASSAPHARITPKGQGMHLKTISKDGVGYLVNGKHAYKLHWDMETRVLKKAQELPGPVDGDHVFDLSTAASSGNTGWLTFLKDPAELSETPRWSIKQCYDYVYAIINDICAFKYQKEDAQYMALKVFYNYLHNAIEFAKTCTNITGEFESGKSTLLSLVENHPQLGGIFGLCLHAQSRDTYTLAGLSQLTNSLALALDEANDANDGSPGSRIVQAFQKRTRGVATGGVAEHAMGAPDKRGASYLFDCPLTLAGATTMVDGMDKSRYVEIRLIKDTNKANSRMLLNHKHPREFYAELRKAIALNCFQYALHFHHSFQILVSQLAHEEQKSFTDDTRTFPVTRFTDSLLPLAAVSQIINNDGMAFLINFQRSREGVLKEQKISMPGYDLIDTILDTPFLEIMSSERPYKRTLRSLLIDPEGRDLINTAYGGITYDNKSQCIGIVWTNVRTALFNNMSSPFSRQPPSTLQRRAEACRELCINPAEAKKLGIVDRLKNNGMAGAPLYTIIRVAHIIADAEDAERNVAKQKILDAPEEDSSDSDSSDDPNNPLDGAGL